jgi:hypothetical protein
LIGASLRKVELQSISVQQQTGTNAAAGVAEIELRWRPFLRHHGPFSRFERSLSTNPWLCQR